MKTLLLEGGDLVLGVSSDYQTISGPSKVKQDLTCALLEPIANDRFHPGWGSSLSAYVGLPADEYLRVNVLGEVNRVVGNYAAVQRDRVETDSISGATPRYTTNEIVAGIASVEVVPVQDSFRVDLTISTASDDFLTISEVL